MLNDLVVSEHDRLLVRTASDYEVNEVFTRRADGTDMLLRSNGELMVTFPGIVYGVINVCLEIYVVKLMRLSIPVCVNQYFFFRRHAHHYRLRG